VGSGLFGLTVANLAANSGHNVTIIDRRAHFGGNAYSEIDPSSNIEIHKYGSHLFHTSNQRVWDYISKFTKFNNYVHRVYAQHKGVVYPLPINLGTINQYSGKSMGPNEAMEYIKLQTLGMEIEKAQNLEEKAIASVGLELYRAFIKGYTKKQWQTSPKLLPPEIIGRLPVRFNYDNRYFNDKWEGLPLQGYTMWFQRMLDHPNITVALNTDFFDPKNAFFKQDTIGQIPVVYTGPIDRYFEFSEGQLGWRTLDFETEVLNVKDFQGTSVMNFSDFEIPYTRIHEYRHLHPERESTYSDEATVISREYSRTATQEDEPYYPINSPNDRSKLLRYRELMKGEVKNHVYFGGRLGTYKYLDMHMAIASALTFWTDHGNSL